MAFKVTLALPAAEDIAQSVEFLNAHSSSAARQWLDEIQNAVESLQEMPLRAPKIPESRSFNLDYRHLIHKAHRIIFRVDEATNTVFVVRVYHSSRAPLGTQDLL